MEGRKQRSMASALTLVFTIGQYVAAFILVVVSVCALFWLVGQPAA